MEQKLIHYADIAWAKFRALYPKLGALRPSIKFNNRLKTCAGYCYHEQRRIEISRELFEEHTEGMGNIIIPHELAHQVTWDLYKKDVGHGPIWKQVMVDFGLPPDRLHSFINTRHAARRAKVKL